MSEREENQEKGRGGWFSMHILYWWKLEEEESCDKECYCAYVTEELAFLCGDRSPHCNDTIPKIWNKYSQKRNWATSIPISTFLCLWAIYILPRSVCLFCCRKISGLILESINRLQTHKCGNWDWGRAIPLLGTHKWDFHCSAAVNYINSTVSLTRLDFVLVSHIPLFYLRWHTPSNISEDSRRSTRKSCILERYILT
jgi:hypothetical protein